MRRTKTARWAAAAVACLALLLLPNSAHAQQLLAQTISTAGADCSTATNCAVYNMEGVASLGVYLDVGASGTFAFEESQDSTNGINGRWGASEDSVGDSSATADGSHKFPNTGIRWLRIRASAISGAADVLPARGYVGAGSSAEITGELMIEVGAQPANDPHFIRCSDGSAAAACVVSGTVTANLSATDNAVLDDIADGIAVTVSGVATAANQTTTIGHVDGLETLIGTTNTSLTTIDGRVDGLEALIGTTNTNTGTIAGDTTDIEAATELLDNIVVVEDAVAGSGFSGVGVLFVRQDSQSDLCADGDFCPPTIDADGNIRVTMAGGSGGTALADDADFAAGSTSFTPIGGFYQSSVTACTDGDTCAIGITSGRAAKVAFANADGSLITQDTQAVHGTALGTITGITSGVLMGWASDTAPTDPGTNGDASVAWFDRSGRLGIHDGGGTITVDGTVTVTDGAGALNVIVDSGTVTTVSTVTTLSQFAGNAINLGSGTIGTGTLRMTVATDDPVNDALVDLDASLLAHDAVDAGSTLAVGFRTIAHGTNPTAVAAADRTVAYANRAGIPFVIGGHPNVITLEAQVQDADGAQTDAALVTCGAGCKVVVTEASVTCDPDTTDDTAMRMGFGTANVPAGAHTGTAGVVLSWDGIPQGGGRIRGDGSGIIGIGADGEDLRLTIGDPAGGSCNVFVAYYTVES